MVAVKSGLTFCLRDIMTTLYCTSAIKWKTTITWMIHEIRFLYFIDLQYKNGPHRFITYHYQVEAITFHYMLCDTILINIEKLSFPMYILLFFILIRIICSFFINFVFILLILFHRFDLWATIWSFLLLISTNKSFLHFQVSH